MNIFIEYENIIKDFVKTFMDVNSYRASLNFSSSVDKAIESFAKNQYDRQTIVDDALKMIAEKRDLYDRTSILVGKVADFLEEHFKDDDLEKIIVSLEPIIFSKSSRDIKREELKRRIKIEELKVFRRFHKILAKKLKEETSKKIPTNSSTGKFAAAKTGRLVKSSPVEPRLGREHIQTAVKSYVSHSDKTERFSD